MGINTERIIISHTILKLVGVIDQFNGTWPIIKHKIEHELGSLKHVSTIASIGSSTRIEGLQMTNEQIDSFLDDIKFLMIGPAWILDDVFKSKK